MTDFQPPTKEEIKEKYGIADNDFDLLVQDALPEASTLQKVGQYVEPLLQIFGVPTFAIKTWQGVVVAIVLIPVWGPTAKQRFDDTIIVAKNFITPPAAVAEEQAEQAPIRYAIALPDDFNFNDNPIDFGSGLFPPNSGIYPHIG